MVLNNVLLHSALRLEVHSARAARIGFPLDVRLLVIGRIGLYFRSVIADAAREGFIRVVGVSHVLL